MIGFLEIHDRLLAAHGPQHWWPASERFEVIVGAVLVQRTTWRNAELAIDALRRQALLSPLALAGVDGKELERCIRSAGFFRIKAERLRLIARFLAESGGLDALASLSTDRLREILLGLKGIGEETADTILLYAFDRPVVIVDEYLRRLTHRLDSSPSPSLIGDAVLRRLVLDEIRDSGRLNELHALVVEQGKRRCTRNPHCAACALRACCGFGRARSDAEFG